MKTETKATPGPWIHEGDGWIRSDSPDVSPAGSRICQVSRNVEANASLIAAAPDLVFQLEDLANILAATPIEFADLAASGGVYRAIVFARDTIAKATSKLR